MRIECNDEQWLDLYRNKIEVFVSEVFMDTSLRLRLLSLELLESDDMFGENLKLLNHITDTDVITIVEKNFKRVDVYLKINKEFKINQEDQFSLYLILHGLMHAAGWKDDLPIQKDRMLKKQDLIFSKVFHVEQKERNE